MGFPEERSKAALKHFRNNIDTAMDYLINTPPENDEILFRSSSQSQSQASSFNPDESALTMLMEMGYGREDSVYALRVTSNNLEHACTYLMNNPNPSAQSSQPRFGFGNIFSR